MSDACPRQLLHFVTDFVKHSTNLTIDVPAAKRRERARSGLLQSFFRPFAVEKDPRANFDPSAGSQSD